MKSKKQLKGTEKKESAKEKRKRIREFAKARDSIVTVVLPVCGAICVVVVILVLLKTNLKW